MAARARGALIRALPAAILIGAPIIASASGLEIPENGADILARGGTAAALPGTAYGSEFNPATLMYLDGFEFRFDSRFVPNSISFARAPYTSPAGQTTNFATVSNSAPLFWAPSFYAAFHEKDWPIALGLALFGPPGVGWYQYPDPRTICGNSGCANNTTVNGKTLSYPYADQQSGQRYSEIYNNASIQLPTIALAVRPFKFLSIGLSAEVAVASISTGQAVAAGSNGGTEAVNADAFANLTVSGTSGPIWLPGILITLIPGLTIGASYRTEYSLDMPGVITISGVDADTILQQKPASGTGSARDISLSLNQPAEARWGLNYDGGRWSIAADGTYEGWSAYNSVILNGSAVDIYSPALCAQVGPSCTQNLGVQTITENWKDTYGARIGGSYKILTETDNKVGLEVSLGGLFDQNAIPPQYQTIANVTGNQWGISGGVKLSYYGFALTLATMGYVPQTLKITNSVVDRGVSGLTGTDPDPVYVGNGTYNVQYWVAAIGISYTGGKL